MDERQQTVLIIDDAPEDRVVIRRYLTQDAPQTYTVIEAARGDTGLQLWREHQPDCILLDHQLPDTDGLALLTALGREAASVLPVVMLVGNGDIAVTVEALKRGAQDFLLKDRLIATELRRAVANTIEKVALQRRIAAERAAQRTSEERLRLAVEVGAIGIWDIDLRSGVRFWSDQSKAIYGLAAHEPMDYERQLTLIHPDDRALVHELVTAFRDCGTLKQLNFEHRIVLPDGAVRWAAVRGEAIYDGAALPVRLIGTLIDITDRKVTEADAQFLADLAERIRLADDADDLLWAVQQAIGEYLQVNRCFFMENDQDHDRSLIRRDYCRGVPSVAGEFRLSDYSPLSRAELEAGRTLINCDSQTNPRTAAWYSATYEPAGERAYVGVPLLHEGRWSATLSVTSNQVRQWQPREILLLETVAERAWLAVEKLRLDATMRFQAQVLAQVSDPVIAIDDDQRVMYWNQSAERQYGISAREALGRPLADSYQYRWLNAEDERASQDALAATGAWQGENIHRLRDGREIYVESSVSRLTDMRGLPSGSLAVVRDISARKRAAAASALLAEASSALAARDEAGMLECVMDLIVPAFADWCLVHYVTDTGQIELGASRCADPAKAALLRELQATYPSDPAWARNEVAQTIQTQQPILVADVPQDWPERIAAGPTYQRLFRALAPRSFLTVPLMARGQLLGLLTWATAEAERRYDAADLDLAQELGRRAALAIDNARLYVAERQARAVAEAAVQARDQFLTMAAHELKNPLTSLLGNAQLLERRVLRDDTLIERDRQTVRTMVNQARRLNIMITTLLDVTRMEMGQLTLDRAMLDLGALVRRLVEELRPTLTKHSMLYDIPDTPLAINGDKLRLEQVFQNLLSNAVKYSPAGGSITVRVERQDQQVCVRVTDQGIGIPAQALPQLFQRFYRVASDATEHISGLGIGLYVVRDLVMLHGGEVQVASVEGQGSTFSVCLPLLSDT